MTTNKKTRYSIQTHLLELCLSLFWGSDVPLNSCKDTMPSKSMNDLDSLSMQRPENHKFDPTPPNLINLSNNLNKERNLKLKLF